MTTARHLHLRQELCRYGSTADYPLTHSYENYLPFASMTIALQLRFAILNPSSSTYSIILINFIIFSYEFYLFPSSSYALDPTTTIFLSDISKLNSLIS
jgi:hypothetical protein